MSATAAPEGLPGALALMAARPDTAGPPAAPAQQPRGSSVLGTGAREAVAAHGGARNGCGSCAGSHAAAAEALGAPGPGDPPMAAPPDPCDAVRRGGREAAAGHLAAARAAGADGGAIHGTVLIAAALCMCDRRLDGLAAPAVTGGQERPRPAAA